MNGLKAEDNQMEPAVKILATWREVLGIADAGVDESFFDLGGSSLLAARLAVRLSVELSRVVSAADILTNPSAKSLIAALTQEAAVMNRSPAERRAAMQQRAFAARRATRA